MTQPITASQIDRLGERLRDGAISEADIRYLDSYRRTFTPAYETVVRVIRDRLGLQPTGRPAKTTLSIVAKLRRETIRLSQMQDIAGCRLIAHDVLTQDRIVQQVQAAFSSTRVFDRRLNPSFGYRAVHVVAIFGATSVEIQIRSSLQHLWAELSEKLSDFDLALKYGGGPPKLKGILGQASELVAAFEGSERQLAAMTHLSAQLAETIDELTARQARLLEQRRTSGSARLLGDIARHLNDTRERHRHEQRYLSERQESQMVHREKITELLRMVADTSDILRGNSDALPDTV